MAVSVAVIVPLDIETETSEGSARRRAYDFVRYNLDAQGLASAAGFCGPPWRKAVAVADGLGRTDAEILVVHDADVVVGGDALRLAISAVENSNCNWAIPHTLVHRLDERSTEKVYELGHPLPNPVLVRWPYVGMMGGGIVVVRRDVYMDCPLDARFEGWGGEDQSWGFALECLHGDPWRGDADLFHLWHPHAAPGAQRPPRVESERLRRAYRAYRKRPDRMRELVGKAGG